MGYDDVAGASLSSMAIANGIRHRFRLASDAAAALPTPLRFGWHDAGVIAVLAVACAFVVLSVVAFFAILFTGRFPRGLFDYLVGVGRWTNRVTAYAFMLATDEYPPFRLRA